MGSHPLASAAWRPRPNSSARGVCASRGPQQGRGSRVDAWVRQAPGRRHCADSSVWVSVMRSTVCVFGYCFQKWKKVHLSMINLKISDSQAMKVEKCATPPSPELNSGSLSLGLIASQMMSRIQEHATPAVKTLNVPCLAWSALTRTWMATAQTVKLMKSAL